MEVRIQSVVVEFMLNHVDVLFSTKLSSLIREGAGMYRHQIDKTPAHFVIPQATAASSSPVITVLHITRSQFIVTAKVPACFVALH